MSEREREDRSGVEEPGVDHRTPARIGVLFGGPSAEHEVSCASALGVARALAGGGYRVVAIGVTRDGGLRLVPEPVLADQIAGTGAERAIDDRLTVTGTAVELRAGRRPGTALVTAAELPGTVHAELDVVFPVLHGPYGEDGVLQGVLESLGVPYVGCGILASAVGMDKVAMKRALRAEGVPVTPDVWFDAQTYRATEDPEKLVVGLRRPLFVKPAGDRAAGRAGRGGRPGGGYRKGVAARHDRRGGAGRHRPGAGVRGARR